MGTENTLASRLGTLAQRYTQSEIARRTGTWVSNVHHYLNGTRVPAEFCMALVEKCGVNAQWLLTGEGPPYAADLAPESASFAADVQKLSRALEAASRLKLGELFSEKRTRALAEINEALDGHKAAQQRASAHVDGPLEELVDRANDALSAHDNGDQDGLPRARGLLTSARQLLRLSDQPIRELEVVALEGRVAIRESRFADALVANRRAFLMSFSVLGPTRQLFIDHASTCASSAGRLGYFREARSVRETALAMARAAGNDPDFSAFEDVAGCWAASQSGTIEGRYKAALAALARLERTKEIDRISASPQVADIALMAGEINFEEAREFGPATLYRRRFMFAWATWTEDITQLRVLLREKTDGLRAVPEYMARFHDRWKQLAALVYRAAWERPKGLWRELSAWNDLETSGTPERERAFKAIRACQLARLCGEKARACELLEEARDALNALPAGMDVFLLERATHHRNALVLGEDATSRKLKQMRADAQAWFREYAAKGYACFAGFGV